MISRRRLIKVSDRMDRDTIVEEEDGRPTGP